MSHSRIQHGLALASAATLISLSCGALAGAAVADPKTDHQGQGQSHGHQSQSHGHQGQSHGHQGQSHGHQGQGQSHDHGQGSSHGQGQGPSHPTGQGNGNGQGSGHNPPGNNGTVKIAGPGDAVGQPSNNPHPGCTFYVEWFGYDEGQDVVSTVTFAPQAPTSDVTIGGTSPSQVFVGGDPAGGGTDLDGRQAYTLSFSGGEPHPKQGYHVKLTVATPHSLGNDTKTKVFWVAPCTDDSTTPSDVESDDTTPDDTTPGETTPGDTTPGDTTPGDDEQGSTDQGVEANTATAPDTAAAAASGTEAQAATGGTAAVPTSVDAGEDASALPDWARSPWPLMAVAGGLTLAGAALARRSRARA